MPTLVDLLRERTDADRSCSLTQNFRWTRHQSSTRVRRRPAKSTVSTGWPVVASNIKSSSLSSNAASRNRPGRHQIGEPDRSDHAHPVADHGVAPVAVIAGSVMCEVEPAVVERDGVRARVALRG
jgi:hypothetical protein